MISIIIPSYNSQGTIRGCLDSVLNQSYAGRYEVILVDSSMDDTPKIAAEHYPQVKLIHFEQKTDPGTARNSGIQASNGNLIAFIDSDCIAAHDWLERMADAHSTQYNVVGGAVTNGNSPDDLIGWAGYLAEFREFLPELPKEEVNHIPTCNISYKRIIFERYGYFQGKYYPQEDLVFNHDITRQGERILRDPSIVVAHRHRSGLRDFLGHQREIGSMTAKVLRVTGLEGSFLAKHAVLAVPMLLPLFAVKFVRTIKVFLQCQPKAILNRPLVLMPLALGLLWWSAGFAQGARIIPGREVSS
ncbi:MAG: putative glycosyltransferase EpsH [Syntrophorhabdus sp. PtaU1.Bin002]|nr:MAG: putative glycosyltransferase EpsH [Syntrophorhabdus sp. PtaB.Bin006]OPY71475.1 MAG: putative glycosyltransferase EpsH [Syntrophorhabdus sp. PtaU1.Bin002]